MAALLSAHPEAAGAKDKGSLLPLHWAVESDASVEVLALLGGARLRGSRYLQDAAMALLSNTQ